MRISDWSSDVCSSDLDGSLESPVDGGRRGSLSIDDEGTPTQENILIEDGILKAYMQDRLNARLMGVAPTGNGRRESFAHAPMPRMTNTRSEEHTSELQSLMRISYAVFCLKKKTQNTHKTITLRSR